MVMFEDVFSGCDRRKLGIAVFLLVGFLGLFFYLIVPSSGVVLTGYAVGTGTVDLYVDNNNSIMIHSPLNISYNFSIGDPYILDLNVSTNFVANASTWEYVLYDLRHDEPGNNGSFSPNTTIVADRWSNRLTVYVRDENGTLRSEEVVFYVNVSNSEPVFGPIDSEIYTCEGERLNYSFNASDVDEEQLTGSIYPSNPFWVEFLRMDGLNVSLFRIHSGVLTKDILERAKGFVSRTYGENVSVIDGSEETNTVEVEIIVMEVNNVPEMDGLGAQTIYSVGENSTFYHQMIVEDEEDGNSSDGNMTFNLSFEGIPNVFEINSSTGVMNYTASLNDSGEVFNLEVCVLDNGMLDVHDNFSVCSDLGYSWDSVSVCDSFSLTVTAENRVPEILNYTPSDNFSIDGTDVANFFVSVYDADGTIPDIDWYVDGVLIEENDGIGEDDFAYSFGCEVRGEHSVEVVVSDGLANVSHIWGIDVLLVACVVPSSGGGGGGSYCYEHWVCDDWDVCQNVERSFDAGRLSIDDYHYRNEMCAQNGFAGEACGFQLKNCYDLNDCNNSDYRMDRPLEMQVCHYTENPSCEDGIKNCHDGGCELLIDCGGPCGICPTCSDGKQNQGEFGVDCGGPCPYRCEVEVPFSMVGFMLIVLLILLILLILFIIYMLRRIAENKEERGDRNYRLFGGR